MQEEYLEVVYKMIKALETPLIDFDSDLYPLPQAEQLEWEAFVDQFAGCLKEAPIERGEQGTYDVREELQ